VLRVEPGRSRRARAGAGPALALARPRLRLRPRNRSRPRSEKKIGQLSPVLPITEHPSRSARPDRARITSVPASACRQTRGRWRRPGRSPGVQSRLAAEEGLARQIKCSNLRPPIRRASGGVEGPLLKPTAARHAGQSSPRRAGGAAHLLVSALGPFQPRRSRNEEMRHNDRQHQRYRGRMQKHGGRRRGRGGGR
jgi:hypothetical protein